MQKERWLNEKALVSKKTGVESMETMTGEIIGIWGGPGKLKGRCFNSQSRAHACLAGGSPMGDEQEATTI